MRQEALAPVIVFDLGGTWWRSAILNTDGVLFEVEIHPAVTRARTGSNAASLQELLIRHVLDRSRELAARQPDAVAVGISIGAATNGHTGQVLASAPLWGDCTDPVDLHAALSTAEPTLRWWIVNDLTSLAIAIASNPLVRERGPRFLTAVTVSSGIGARTINVETGWVDLDPVHGIQGEIGHLPSLTTASSLWGEPPVCDCAAVGHVAAISSGTAIDKQLAGLADVLGLADPDTGSRLARLRAGLDAGSDSARAFLDYVTAPLTRALLYLMAVDARVEQVVLAGGVLDSLGEHYLASVYRNAEADGLYLISTYQPTVFRDRISRWVSDGLDPLRGAGEYTRRRLDGGPLVPGKE
ncbi:ROK family protein [Nocardia sp. NBC_01377]|uniref:ROK family protein n=1 Tax=Nocardia sp. NBC_01377 TaxID=2903595 RepID=UPI0032489DF8